MEQLNRGWQALVALTLAVLSVLLLNVPNASALQHVYSPSAKQTDIHRNVSPAEEQGSTSEATWVSVVLGTLPDELEHAQGRPSDPGHGYDGTASVWPDNEQIRSAIEFPAQRLLRHRLRATSTGYDAPTLLRETHSVVATKSGAGLAGDPFTKLANGGGPTIKVVTSLDSPPVAGRSLSVSVGGDGLAKAANASGTLYEAALPKALVDELVYKGLAQQKVTNMGGVTGTEIRFYPGATQYIVDFFKAAK